MIRTATQPGKLFDRQPPCSIEAEMSLLGSMILDPRIIPDVTVRPEDYYDERHGLVHRAIVDVYNQNQGGDLVQLREVLSDRGHLDQIGGVDYLVRLAQDVPTAANAMHYAVIVAERARARRLIDACAQTLYDAYHAQYSPGELDRLVSTAEARMFALGQGATSAAPQPLAALVAAEVQRVYDIENGAPVVPNIKTGLLDLDLMTTGFEPGQLIVIGARPSMGKTSLAMVIAEQVALGTDGPPPLNPTRPPVPVGVFSLEMSSRSIARRFLAMHARINLHRIRDGEMSYQEGIAFADSASILSQARIIIDEQGGVTVDQLRSKARRMVHREGVKLILIDYLQLIRSDSGENRNAEISAIMRDLKATAKELAVPLVVLSQLNRANEQRQEKRPSLSDLRDSGSIEQDADIVCLLHRESYYHQGDRAWHDANPDGDGQAELRIAKNRDGPTDTVPLSWDAATTRFLNSTRAAGATP